MRIARWALLAIPLALLVMVALGQRAVGTRYHRPSTFTPDSTPEAYRRSVAALMWPGTTRSLEVTSAGDLYNGVWIARIIPGMDGVSATAPRVIAYEDRWCPVAHWTRLSGALRWEFEAAALPEPVALWRRIEEPVEEWMASRADAQSRQATELAMRAYPESHLDSVLVHSPRKLVPRPEDRVGLIVSLAVRVTNTAPVPHQARLEILFGPPDSTSAFRAFDAPPETELRFGWGSGAGLDSVIGWSSKPAGGTRLDDRWRLAPGESRSARWVLPSYPTPARELRHWARKPHARWAAQARDYWAREVDRGTRFELGDPEIENAIRAARVVLLACRERRGGRWVPLGGPFHYRDVWLRDGARAIQALALVGYTREARELAGTFEEFQWPNGPFMSQGAQMDGTGQALWAFEQAMLRPHPDRSVSRYADDALRAWRWFERQRVRPAAKSDPYGSMLPEANPRDNELVRAQLVGTDAWALAGYRATSRLLTAAHREREAERVEKSRTAYRLDFERALNQTGSPDIPPSWQNTGFDWGNLAVAYPCDALPASHPRVAALARRYWAEAGGAGLGYGSPDRLHGYVGADLATWALLARRPAEADSVLRSLVFWRSASGGGAELFSREARDFGTNLPPHATSASALLTLVRNMLVFDDEDTLALTLGARSGWWKHGRVLGAPTRWGMLDLDFRAQGGWATWAFTPVPVWTALYLPQGTELAGTPASPLRPGPRPDVVLAPPGVSEARVALKPRT